MILVTLNRCIIRGRNCVPVVTFVGICDLGLRDSAGRRLGDPAGWRLGYFCAGWGLGIPGWRVLINRRLGLANIVGLSLKIIYVERSHL